MSRGLCMLAVFAVACTARGGVATKPDENARTRLAVEFARALGSGDHARAHGLLSAKMRTALTPEQLAAQYREMVSYGTGAPTVIQVITTMEEWPDKQPGDQEWVYVAIANDTYSEGATIVVAEESSRLVVRSVEWGRP